MIIAIKVLVCWILLVGDPEVNCVEVHNTEQIRSDLKTICIKQELMDDRELKYVLFDEKNFVNDLKLLQNRYKDLADAPKLADCKMFATRELASEYCQFNRSYRRNLEAQIPWNLDRQWIYKEVLRETDYLYQIWDLVRDINCEFYYVSVRRNALLRLQKMLQQWDGDKFNLTYYGFNRFPPFVPYWRFIEVP